MVLMDGMVERLLHEAAEHLAAHLITEHALEHLTGCLPRSESRQTRLSSDEREGAIDLGLNGRSTDLDLQALAARPEFLERDLWSVHRVPWRATGNARGGTRTPTVAREILSLVRLPIPPLSRRAWSPAAPITTPSDQDQPKASHHASRLRRHLARPLELDDVPLGIAAVDG